MFKNATPIYSKSLLKEKNTSLFIPIDYKGKNVTLNIAGENEFQVFCNGKLVGYGPAKGAHGYHRVDTYKIDSDVEENRLVIIVAGYNVFSFDRFKQDPFICFELKEGEEVITYSSLDTKAYKYEPRYQKVCRFSYQRQFSESYKNSLKNDIFFYKTPISFSLEELTIVKYGEFTSRNVHYPKLDLVSYKKVQEENVTIDKSIKPFDVRYMWMENLLLFKKEEWEYDSNSICSQLVINKSNRYSSILNKLESATFSNDVSLTGFIKTKINVLKPSTVYVYFDEVNTSNDETIDFKFYRNETQNVITYELNEGEYSLVSFQPYTAKYIRVVCLEGSIEVQDIGMILLENPDSYNLKYSFQDLRIQKIMDAARNTFASNAVDILTDCPSRERAGWLCDSYFSGRSEMLFTGFNLVENNYLENYANAGQRPDVPENMVPMCYPADFAENGNFIPNWAMFYVLQLKEHFRKIKDDALLENSKQNVRNLLKYFKTQENSDGLLENLKGWVFVEWSFANSEEAIAGVNVPSNALYSAFLEASGEILNNNELKKHALKIKNWIKQNAFNGTYFVDNLIRNEKGDLVQTKNIGETTQYYVLYFNVVNKDEMPEFFDYMLKEFGPNRDVKVSHSDIYKSNMIIGNYQRLEILNRYGLYEQTLSETIDYFSKMANITGTLWEHDSIFASLNHGFASFIANIIFEAVTGLREIDYQNKILYVRQSKFSEKFEISLPILNERIQIFNKNGKIEYSIPDSFKIVEI